jgi:ferritin-like metal-binding protein YciE
MAEPGKSETKVIQYLNEAYAKEKELETALQAHVKMASGRATYKKRLQDHLKETKAQARNLERRIKKLGGKADAVNIPGPDVAGQVAGEAEKLLKNAKTELWNEYEEIANYIAIEELAKALGDTDTEKLAREHRRQEERMANFLTKLLPQLTKAVVTEEIPASERRRTTTRRRSTTRARSTSSRSGSRSSGRSTSRRTTSRSRSTASRSS